jgi:putative chitobiose transport system permease protein
MLEPRRPVRILLGLLMALLALAWLAPLVWTVTSGLRPSAEIFAYTGNLGWRTFLPTAPTADNVHVVLAGPLGRAVANSVLVAVGTVVCGVVVSAMAAYGLTAFEFRGRGLVLGVIVLTFMVPFEALAIPLAAATRSAGLENTWVALILPGVGNGLAIFLLRQFFLEIPRELAEAAEVDGAGPWRVFRHVYLPLSMPALVGAGIVIFVFQWQAYLWPLLVTTDPSMDVGPVALARLFGQYGVDWGALFAAASLLCLVPAVILLVFQRSFVESITGSAVKG